MSSIPSNVNAISPALQSQTLMDNMQRTNGEMLKLQEQLSTGKRVNRPSDEPTAVGSIMSLRTALERVDQRLKNLEHTGAVLNNTDAALSDVSALLLEAESIASSQIGITANPDTRANQAVVIEAHLTELMEIANREHQGVHLFAGRASTEPPIESSGNGFRYVGGTDNLQADLDLRTSLGVNTNGASAFGALSSRVQGTVDLDPDAAATTRITDVAGARNRGVTLSSVRVTVDGNYTDVDLNGADTLGDVVTRVNNAIDGWDPTAGSLAIGPDGFELTANVGHTITIGDIASGVTALDLGIAVSATDATTVGADVDPRLTELTELAALGPAIDWASGIQITNGGITETIDLSSANTIRDVINLFDRADVGVRVEVNADRTGLNLINEVSGAELTVAENGGTTAGDLGLRTFDATTQLSVLNHGRGVQTVNGVNDLQIGLHDGSTIDVNLDGVVTVQDVIDAINTAGGGSVTAAVSATGGGLELTDLTAGGNDFSVAGVNGSAAAEDLGIKKSAGAGNTIDGDGVAAVRAESVFTHLMMLREALLTGDDRAITEAGEKLNEDLDRVTVTRADVGVRARRVQQTTEREENGKLFDQSLLSDVQDSDFAEAISRFMQLQQQLEANMLAGQRSMQMNLMDFLR